MSERYWFIRSRGRVLGPFTVPQLEAMRARGQFTQFFEISEDRLNWESAATLTHLFPPSTGGASAAHSSSRSIAIDDEPAAPASRPSGQSDGWFFAVGDHRQGPIPFDDLQGRASRGEIRPETLIWSAGMADWAPARSVAGLNFQGASPAGPADPGSQGPVAPYPTRTSGMAIASMVLGILWLYWIGSLLAVIFGRIALGEIDRSRGTVGGRGMAVTGLVLGIIGLSMLGLTLLVFILAGASGPRF